MNSISQRPPPENLNTVWLLLGVAALLSLLISCSRVQPVVHVTGQDYLILKAGQVFTAPRDMTLATESVIQRKDEQILDLLEANQVMQRSLTYERSR